MLERSLKALEDVAEAFREAYEPVEAGGFVLKPEYVAAIEQNEAELAALAHEQEVELARRDQMLEARTAELKDILTIAALREELMAADVKSGLIEGAIALIRQSWAFEFDEENLSEKGRPMVVTPDGPQRLELAVAAWLASPAGKPFARPQNVIDFPNLRPSPS